MNYASYAAIHARHLPDKVCLIERTPSQNLRRTLTWQEFNNEINKVANYLSGELGIKDGDFVMHLQNNSLEWVITYYAIIKLGQLWCRSIFDLSARISCMRLIFANPKPFCWVPNFYRWFNRSSKISKPLKNMSAWVATHRMI